MAGRLAFHTQPSIAAQVVPSWLEGNGVFPTTTSCSNFWTDVYFDQ